MTLVVKNFMFKKLFYQNLTSNMKLEVLIVMQPSAMQVELMTSLHANWKTAMKKFEPAHGVIVY